MKKLKDEILKDEIWYIVESYSNDMGERLDKKTIDTIVREIMKAIDKEKAVFDYWNNIIE